ncbi:MAG TPA: UdgX family uracil-DNA binding protein [Vicinamibacterales bacterium]|nr:UdgX family uracil-DNA binding protein [Vicinamibacterales bacterium]
MAKKETLSTLRKQAAGCRRCDLWQRGTQTVFGEGSPTARVMFVGEQPGDQEDLAGEPFVGPAGQLLRDAIVEAGLNPEEVYLTNAVKHFKWQPRGKRRIHERPNREEVLACRMWLTEEIAAVKPHLIVALGATAAGTLLGSAVKVMRDRAKFFDSTLAPLVTLTVHPSSILRAPDSAARKLARDQFVADLKSIAAKLKHAK